MNAIMGIYRVFLYGWKIEGSQWFDDNGDPVFAFFGDYMCDDLLERYWIKDSARPMRESWQ